MMSNKNLELCECPKCKRNGTGKYVHPTTKWRHFNKSKKRKYNIELIDNDIIDEKYGCDDDDNYNSDDKYIVVI